ncbi:MAG TPA: LTA synthase family protein [Lentimicrobium sp.]|nr:LTA synthase family protein [Lentimicrobium sp.]
MKLNRLNNIGLTIGIYVLSIAQFLVFRILFFIIGIENIDSISDNSQMIAGAFLMGVRFDIVICGYLLLLPFIILSIIDFTGDYRKIFTKVAFYLVLVLFTIAFLINAADIPYFNQFFSRLSISAFQWFDSPVFVIKMILEEPLYWLYLLPFFVLTSLYFILLKKLFHKFQVPGNGKLITRLALTLVFLGIMLIGIRGRISEKAPIKVGTAYNTDSPFINQLGLNPVFTLMQSYLENLDNRNQVIRLIDDKEAIVNIQHYLDIEKSNDYYPLYREVIPDTISKNKPNVIIVIMESMTASKMRRHGNTDNLTPFLDSLAENSYYFDSIYTAGIHTYNGVFSTLFSYPAIFRQQPMRESKMLQYNGISETLSALGYSTSYFTTHDGQFDNIEGFLISNHFDEVISVDDYPEDAIKTTLGVPDDYLFRYNINHLNDLAATGKPFFATFMTASNHGPYYIPEYYKPRNEDVRDQAFEYADWSLEQFMKLASKQSWFNNTMFVFVADHGLHKKRSYEISLEYHHTPLIFFAPGLLKGKHVFNQIGGQIDVYPTIMGFLQQPWVNNTLGIDLMKESRPYIMVNSEMNYGVIGKNFFLIVKPDGRAGLYKYKKKSMVNYITSFPRIAKDMDHYAKVNLQSFEYINDNGKNHFTLTR